MHKYSFGLITLVIILLYILSIVIVRNKKLTKVKNRKIWNFLLLFSFVISGILGLILLIPNHNIELPYQDYLLKLHVQAGIVLFYISLIHFLWHKKYYRIKN